MKKSPKSPAIERDRRDRKASRDRVAQAPSPVLSDAQARQLIRNSTMHRRDVDRAWKQARRIASRTRDAYSRDFFLSWPACACYLLLLGYSPSQVERLLRSKLMRWVYDRSDAPVGKATVLDLSNYIERFGTHGYEGDRTA